MSTSFSMPVLRSRAGRGAGLLVSVIVSVLAGAASFSSIAQPAAAGDPPVSEQGRGRFTEAGGESVYRGLCQGCHMPDGKGAKGAGFYPALAANPRLAAGPYPATVVTNGYKAMPSFKQSLSDEQIVDVVNYVRTHFGNQYTDPVSAADVKALR